MALLSVPSDHIPARAKIDLQLHQPYRTWLGFGRLRCDWCEEPWGRHGCPARESAARLFLYTATPAQKTAALDSGDLTTNDLRLRRSTPSRHRRKPSPYPRAATAATPRHHRTHGQTRLNPLAALRLELQGAAR